MVNKLSNGSNAIRGIRISPDGKHAFVSRKRLKDVCPVILENLPNKDYALLDSGNGLKLERYGKLKIVRPEAQAIWQPQRSSAEWKDVDAIFTGDTTEEGVGRWAFPKKQLPDTWSLLLNFFLMILFS